MEYTPKLAWWVDKARNELQVLATKRVTEGENSSIARRLRTIRAVEKYATPAESRSRGGANHRKNGSPYKAGKLPKKAIA